MQVEYLGDGDPELAIVAGIHGDEPAGVRAVRRLLAESPEFLRPVAVVIANERALDAGKRYLDADLNRSFPGDPGADAHERRLAAELYDELKGLPVVDLHSTKSQPTPFAIVHGTDERRQRLATSTGVEHVVDADPTADGGLVSEVGGVVVEVGPAGSETAVDQADRALRSFLFEYGALDADDAFGDDEPPAERADPTVYRMRGPVEGAGYEVLVENFERVPEGEVFARRDGEELRAEEPFWPVLMSTDGYADLVGFTAEKVGKLSAVEAGSEE